MCMAVGPPTRAWVISQGLYPRRKLTLPSLEATRCQELQLCVELQETLRSPGWDLGWLELMPGLVCAATPVYECNSAAVSCLS